MSYCNTYSIIERQYYTPTYTPTYDMGAFLNTSFGTEQHGQFAQTKPDMHNGFNHFHLYSMQQKTYVFKHDPDLFRTLFLFESNDPIQNRTKTNQLNWKQPSSFLDWIKPHLCQSRNGEVLGQRVHNKDSILVPIFHYQGT